MPSQEDVDDNVVITFDPPITPAPPAPLAPQAPLALVPQAIKTTPAHSTPGRPVQGGSKKQIAYARLLQSQMLKLCLPVFFREHAPVRTLGFTSAATGEGKTLMAMLASTVLAEQTGRPVTLLDCNWDHASLHEQFGLPARPGMAEWLRQECALEAVRHQVDERLCVISAGMGAQDAIALMELLRQRGLAQMLIRPDELMVVDLPSILASSYGVLAARLVGSLIVVVRAAATSKGVLTQACTDLDHLPVEGILLNRVRSNIPVWLQHIL